MKHRHATIKAIAYAILLCFTSLTGAQPLYAIPANTQLPQLPTDGQQHFVGITKDGITVDTDTHTMTINQGGSTTSVIKWDDFSIGADATVNFKGPDGFNSLNYVTNGPVSEIYGQLTALGGNIFIANPAGVQIGNSAQINVGSFYVTNKDIGEAITNGKLKIDDTTDIASEIKGLSVADTNAELMSLGAIVNAKSVTFDGGRIVLDADRIYADNAEGELQPVADGSLAEMLDIITTDKDNVVLGSSERDVDIFNSFSINGGNDNLEKGYTWIHDLAELQGMNKNTSGWYALRNSIDANATASTGFNSIGTDANHFTGRFDGLGYSIFGLSIKQEDKDYVGLFGYAKDSTIRNFTLNSSEIKGGANTGAAVGHAVGGKIENVTNTGNVTGGDGTGGIVGKAENNVVMSGLINIGKVVGQANTGGIVGSMSGSTLGGDTYNLGSVTGNSSVGGIAGSVTNATIGNEVTQDNPDAFQIFNQLNVTGGYNVGGIVGSISDGSVTNAANYGDVTANGLTKDDYSYHTAADSQHLDGAILNDGLATIVVNVSNAGGIAGNASDVKISDVHNDGDVKTSTGDDGHYIAGNVGGIAGRAENTTITNAENKENTVAGAHNVGGIAGYLGGQSTVEVGVNNGGDITATGARKYSENDTAGYAKERVRPYSQYEDELFNVGNIGGIVGYLFGDDAKIKNSGNRGTVHSEKIQTDTAAADIPETAKAANVGGVVGKIDSGTQPQVDDVQTSENGVYINATVANSYSTGDVQGYTGVGGVVGMMHNGSIAGSYNLGTVQSTRAVEENSRDPLNMGGVVGDTTEDSKASAVLYDVYNAGQIGDEEFTFYGRHVGGVVGRLSGDLAKAYNTGEIYNGYSTVGGIVGWWAAGDIKNVFNTGNITVVNNDKENGVSQVGGIAGAHSGAESTLSYAYNLGTIRSFSPYGNQNNTNTPLRNAIGGIIGYVRTYRGEDIGNNNKDSKLKIYNVYTTNNLFAAKDNGGNATYTPTNEGLGAIYGRTDYAQFRSNISNSYYVKMYESGFDDPINLTGVTNTVTKGTDGNYKGFGSFIFHNQFDNAVDNSVDSWRIYDGTTPILNAFLPDAEGYFSALTAGQLSELGIAGGGIQYGTAANPLLTIIDAKDSSNVTLDWEQLTSSGNASFAVYGGGLTLNHFGTDVGYYRGTLYADGELAINGAVDEAFQLGSSAKLYGTNVEIDANGDAVIYGNVTSTNGGLFINGDDIEIIGKLESSVQDGEKSVKNIAKKMADDLTGFFTKLSNPKEAVSTVSDAYARTTGKAKTDGAITVTASGNADILYGNLATGSVVSGSAFSVTSENGSVYVDSDLGGVKGGISLTADGEALFDISNIAAAGEAQDDQYGAKRLIEFLANHKQDSGNGIKLTSKNDDAILAVDMWEEDSFTLDKFNITGTTFSDAIKGLGDDLAGKTHIWISDADQLKGIQLYKDMHEESGILGYNFALKGNIDATELTDYDAIGGDAGYSGTFDGRDFRIIGLNSDAQDNNSASEGIFSKLSGTVKDLRVYASKFFGNTEGNGNVGAIAAVTDKNAEITGVTTFGNHVEAGAGGNAGGIAGTNAGTITDSAASDSVIANNGAAGGVAGSNAGTIGEAQSGGEDSFITSESAVTSATNADTTNTALGGIVGVNEESGNVYLANSLGVTNGGTAVDNVGGIAGQNHGTMSSLYNESIVSGRNNVGGVAGANDGEMNNAVNTTAITAAGSNVGGIAGTNSGEIDSGRNAGTINGGNYVGGMVGNNGASSVISNLVNSVFAAITGENYVGGIAGDNAGTISGSDNLINYGKIYGQQFVGGIAGINELTGKIENTNTDMTLYAKDSDAKYFGGVAGQNKGTITDASNTGNITAEGASYVGGIVGMNGTEDSVQEGIGNLTGEIINAGNVVGESNVGGIAGINQNSILLQRKDENDKLTLSNAGVVKATDGSAGGIFYENKDAMNWVKLVNSGTVDGGSQSDTGGIFGVNSGSAENSVLTNSGTVNGAGDVGGLFGSNSGDFKNSSLFATVEAKVTGTGNNVGGLIGMNSGKLSKAYNTTYVIGTATFGNAIGNNAADGRISNVYATNADGNLIGENNASEENVTNVYTFAADDDSATKIEDDKQKLSESYNGFNSEWKNYDGSSTPMLDVFLTDLKFNDIGKDGASLADYLKENLVYNGKEQNLYIGEMIEKGFITGPNGWTDAFLAHNNTTNASSPTGDSAMIFNTEGQINANSYSNWLASAQIAGSSDGASFTPNNLGYDISLTAGVQRRTIDISDIAADIIYGGTKFDDVTIGEDGTLLINVVEGDDIYLAYNGQKIVDIAPMINDNLNGEYASNKGNRNTADVKRDQNGNIIAYENAVSIEVSLGGSDKNNYTFVEGTDTYTDTISGKITVNPAELKIALGDVERTYGDTKITKGGYTFDYAEGTTLVNGDEGLSVNTKAVTDDAVLGGKTNDVKEGGYTWKIAATDLTGVENLTQNYNVTVINTGKSSVNKRNLSVTDLIAGIVYGSKEELKLKGSAALEGVAYDDDIVTLETANASLNVIGGSAYETNKGDRDTADTGLYENSLNVTGLALGGGDAGNYELNSDNTGSIQVDKASLEVTLDEVTRIYGTLKPAEGSYKITSVTDMTNGDDENDLTIGNIADGALESASDETRTRDVGKYEWSGVLDGVDNVNKNYAITFTGGESHVKKKPVRMGELWATIVYGDQGGKGLTVNEEASLTGGSIVYGDNVELNFDGTYSVTGAYEENRGARTTADVGRYENSLKADGLVLTGQDAGNYTLADTDAHGSIEVTQAALTVSLNGVSRTYGDTTLTDGAYSVDTNWLHKLVNGDKLIYTGDEISISEFIGDEAVIGEYTNNAGGHSWSAKIDAAALAHNYDINEIATGSSIVNKAKLTVNAGNVETTYGTRFDKGKYYYDLVGVTNGDSDSEIKAQIGDVVYDNTAAIEDGGDRVTGNAGVSGVLSILTNLFGIELGNYEIEAVNEGMATVEKADLFITAHDKLTRVGREPEYTGTTYDELNGSLVNGDDLSGFMHAFGIEDAEMLNNAGHYPGKIGVVVDGLYYYDGTHDWSGHHGVFANYNVNVATGSLHVFVPVPDSSFNYGWLYDDAPYSRKWNFRERKAEIYFQDGGMEYNENM